MVIITVSTITDWLINDDDDDDDDLRICCSCCSHIKKQKKNVLNKLFGFDLNSSK